MSARTNRLDVWARARFGLVLGLFALVTWLVFRDRVLGDALMTLRTGTAEVTAALLNLVGLEAARQATAVFHPAGFGMEISRGCTGLVGSVLLAVAILAYPADRNAKWAGLAICPLSFLLVNFVRLVHLFYLGVYHVNVLHTAHAVVWQGVMFFLVIALWLTWKWAADGRMAGERMVLEAG
jgi:exosortase/archaeosortase family protein